MGNHRVECLPKFAPLAPAALPGVSVDEVEGVPQGRSGKLGHGGAVDLGRVRRSARLVQVEHRLVPDVPPWPFDGVIERIWARRRCAAGYAGGDGWVSFKDEVSKYAFYKGNDMVGVSFRYNLCRF